MNEDYSKPESTAGTATNPGSKLEDWSFRLRVY